MRNTWLDHNWEPELSRSIANKRWVAKSRTSSLRRDRGSGNVGRRKRRIAPIENRQKDKETLKGLDLNRRYQIRVSELRGVPRNRHLPFKTMAAHGL
jgi:hypothetical protein